jgi:hypothetical protein
MTDSVTISLAELVDNARLAHKEGRLQAQTSLAPVAGFDASDQRCLYTGPCAIGVSVPREAAQRWDYHDVVVSALLRSGFLVVTNGSTACSGTSPEVEVVRKIQSSHDAWKKAYEEYRPGYEYAFLQALDEAEALVKDTE